MSFYNIDYVVRDVMMDCGMSVSSPHYIQFTKWAINAYRRLNLAGVMPTLKCVQISIDSTSNTAPLPDDFVDYYKIGLCCGGYLLNFSVNDSICLPVGSSSCPCDIDQLTYATEQCNAGTYDYNTQWFYPYYQYSHNGQMMNGIYGAGAGFYAGGSRIDTERNLIQFDSTVTASAIVLEYRSNGLGDPTGSIVPEYALPAMREYLHWQRCRFSRDAYDRQMANEHRTTYSNYAMAMNAFGQSDTYSEWLQTFRDYTYQLPKR